MNKICIKCKKEKNLKEFYSHPNKKTSKVYKAARCKLCYNQDSKAYNVKYRKTERGKRLIKKYDQSDKSKKRKKVYQRGKGRGKATQARIRYNKTEKGKLSAARRGARRRSKMNSVINDLTLPQWNQILTLQGNACNSCDISFDKVKATRDHIIPVSKGGGLTKDNVQALCGPCNSSKGAR